MIRRPPRSTRTDTLFPYTTLFRSRAGMVRQASAGIYSWLPLGYRVLKNIERIVREEQDRAGAQEVLMPTIQSAELWRKSGRYDGYGKEMLRIVDRHEREMLYGPTNEEQRSEERSVGKACVSTCRSRGSQYH